MPARGLLLLALAALAVGAQAQVTRGPIAPLDGQEGQGPLPNRLAGAVGLTEFLGASVPTDLTFLDEEGETVQLASIVDGERPTVVAFVYHSCPMLCSLVLDGLANAIATSDLVLGEDYTVLAVSVDPRDTPEMATRAKARYVRLAEIADTDAFHFWTVGDSLEANVEALADAVGFRYAWDPRTSEYAHTAALTLLSPDGKITRYLYGIEPAPLDFKLGLVEASEGTVGNALDRFLITCYEYDEDAQSYSLAVLTVTKIAGAVLLVVFGGLLLFFWRREGSRPDDWGDAPTPAPAR
ncbi:SCO family protein [Rubrivirga sp. IMCC45206]|uniref:SCO family protein n=1 Tax=Rubrivirga sp. IMCC45206 TaxID=3391614 RepID=UPI00398FFCCA